jgi:hypothetical protein
VATLQEQTRELRSNARSSTEDLDAVLKSLGDTIAEFETRLGGAIQAAAAAARKDEVEAALKRHDYRAAAAVAVAARPMQRAPTPPAPTLAAAPTTAAALGPRAMAWMPPIPAVTFRVIRPVVQLSIPQQRARVQTRQRTLQLFLWAISAVLTTLVGALLFYDGFVGTAPDLCRLFAWGFGFNVGIDAVTAQLASVRGRNG